MAYLTITPGTCITTEIDIKRSRFIGYAAEVTTEEQAREIIAEIRKEHYDARHVCHAFVCHPHRDVQRSSDDGEPSGTAGIPILDAIVKRVDAPSQLVFSDLVVVVVRYFGGIKLGAGGLVQAYSATASATLDLVVTGDGGKTAVIERAERQRHHIDVDLVTAAKLETSLRALGYDLEPTDYRADSATLTVLTPLDDDVIGRTYAQIQTLTAGHVTPVSGETVWLDLPYRYR